MTNRLLAGTAVVMTVISLILGAVKLDNGTLSTPKRQITNWKWPNSWGTTPKPTVIPVVTTDIPTSTQNLMASTFEEAIKLAEQHNKKILLYIYSSSCSWCDKMQADTLSNSMVKDKIKDFVYFTNNQATSKSKFRISGVPASIILDSKGNVVRQHDGYMNAEKFVNFLAF